MRPMTQVVFRQQHTIATNRPPSLDLWGMGREETNAAYVRERLEKK